MRPPFTPRQEDRIRELIEERFTIQRRLDAIRPAHQRHWAENLIPPQQDDRRLV